MVIHSLRLKMEADLERTFVVTGAASGIGAATARRLRAGGGQVIACDLHGVEVIADLATVQGRESLVEQVSRISGGRIDAVVANAGGGPPETSLSLNYFGAVATLEGLRPLMEDSPAPRAVAVSSIASMRPDRLGLVEACLSLDEGAAIAVARRGFAAGQDQRTTSGSTPVETEAPLALYGAAKQALQLWCRKVAVEPQWAGAGIPLNVVALGFYDTPAAAYVLANAQAREVMAKLEPLRGAFPGHPNEAAALLAWCVSPENSQMTGQILYADGGAECLARKESAS
jgi:NAD(P)-dependent dehydrogenase (short-subunit alcohol dehydrogenase family)